jgi:hypothetical protein
MKCAVARVRVDQLGWTGEGSSAYAANGIREGRDALQWSVYSAFAYRDLDVGQMCTHQHPDYPRLLLTAHYLHRPTAKLLRPA